MPPCERLHSKYVCEPWDCRDILRLFSGYTFRCQSSVIKGKVIPFTKPNSGLEKVQYGKHVRFSYLWSRWEASNGSRCRPRRQGASVTHFFYPIIALLVASLLRRTEIGFISRLPNAYSNFLAPQRILLAASFNPSSDVVLFLLRYFRLISCSATRRFPLSTVLGWFVGNTGEALSGRFSLL